MKVFSDMKQPVVLKILEVVKREEPIDVKDMMGLLIKNNQPETLRKAFDAIGTGDVAAVEIKAFRKLMESVVKKRYIKSNIDSLTPDKFNGQMFLKEIDQLGNTAKELFGNETGKIRELATKVENRFQQSNKRNDWRNMGW